ncbi:MAG: S8/S53 family peptidase, partial [Mycolicibacterium sp.]|nr:S8/S53 family peptidase [Mycolicibacterium sp.]
MAKDRQRVTPLSGSERPRPPGSRFLSALDVNEQVSATLVIRPESGSPALPDHHYWEVTPLGQRQLLSPQQYAQTYGASEADIEAATAFAASHGLRVLETHSGRRTVAIVGSAAKINAAFGIELNRYETPRPRYRARARAASKQAAVKDESPDTHIHHGYDGAIHIPDSLAEIVTAVIGLDNRALGGPGASSGDPPGAEPLPVSTVAGLYNFPNTGAADQVIGVIAPSEPVGTANQILCGYLQSDIKAYFNKLSNSHYQTPPASFTDISLTVGANTYSNSTTTVQNIDSSNYFTPFAADVREVTQDICTATTVAQGAHVNVYFTEHSEQGLLVCLNRILQPEGESQPTVVTCSFSWNVDDPSFGIGNWNDSGATAYQVSAVFQALATVGVGVFIISQDEGSDAGVNDGKTHVAWPGSDPYVTSVGGTVISQAPPAEWVWSNAGSSSAVDELPGASGGGPSHNFPVPSYQSSAGITAVTDSQNNATQNQRCVPDVAAMIAYGGSGGKDQFPANGIFAGFAGTSSSCPLVAGLYAVLCQALGVNLGFFNPTLYQIGSSVCNDITYGTNDPADSSKPPFYNARPNWDPCTGWGSIDGTKLLNAIAAELYTPNWYFLDQKPTFGLDEVKAKSPSTYDQVLWLVLEGYTPDQVTTADLQPQVNAVPGIDITVNGPEMELPSQTSTPQRITFACTISFESWAVAPQPGGLFPVASGTDIPVSIRSTIPFGGGMTANTTLYLEAGANPYFANYDAANSNVFYRSESLRVFTVTPGYNNPPYNVPPIDGISLNVPDSNNFHTGAGYAYIQALLADPSGEDPFVTLLPDQNAALSADSSVRPYTPNPAGGAPFANYNFAVARVRLDGTLNESTVKNVRVFFRMFASETSDTDYQPSTYPSNSPGGLP